MEDRRIRKTRIVCILVVKCNCKQYFFKNRISFLDVNFVMTGLQMFMQIHIFRSLTKEMELK